MIRAWLLIQAALVGAWLSVELLDRLGLPARLTQTAGRLAVMTALLCPLLLAGLPDGAPLYEAPAQLWSDAAAGGGARLELHAPSAARRAPAASLALPAAPPLWLIAGGLALLVAWQARRLREELEGSVAFRRRGALEVRVGQAGAPFALWWPGRSVVVVDPDTLADPEALRMALRHEGQHHRSGDTRFAWVLAFTRLVGLPNPAAARLARKLEALDELACDAALLEGGRVAPAPYAHLLLNAAARRSSPLGAVGLNHPTLLHRRLHAMTQRSKISRLPRALALALPVALALGAGLAADSLAADNRVDPAELEQAVASLEAAGFTASTHPDVLVLAERMAGSPEAAARLDAALARRAAHEAVIIKAFDRHAVPHALMAVPLVESGWRNLDASANPIGAAGLWQFIAPTARDYGLTVSEEADERLDVALASDAAARLLADLYARFDDWGLAIAAYNAGAKRVELAIEAQGTRDVHLLIEAKALPDYANAVFAAALVSEGR